MSVEMPANERFGFRQIESGPLAKKWVVVDHQTQRVFDYKPDRDLALGLCLLLEMTVDLNLPDSL
ncbi:hypothetical protein M0R72_08995 [Candidatus Pacearchaeota archaeon]|jgi:hypothetical protein|nr:hypothetical protein [Candidatus Pacearchaeota archaeon]